MVQRVMSNRHPSIIIWSNGNEGGWNYQLDKLFAQYDKLQKRHVVHPWADFNDSDTHHYPAYLTGVARFTNGYKVFMPTEFMHAMYDQGGGAGLRDFWIAGIRTRYLPEDLYRAFCDEAPKRSDKGGILEFRYSQMRLMEVLLLALVVKKKVASMCPVVTYPTETTAHYLSF